MFKQFLLGSLLLLGTHSLSHANETELSHENISVNQTRFISGSAVADFFTEANQTIQPNHPIAFMGHNIAKGIKRRKNNTQITFQRGGTYFISYTVLAGPTSDIIIQPNATPFTYDVGLFLNGKVVPGTVTSGTDVIGNDSTPFLFLARLFGQAIINIDSDDILELRNTSLNPIIIRSDIDPNNRFVETSTSICIIKL